MKIFVTGGGGFIGSSLVSYLYNKGHEITIFDNFSNCSRKNTQLILKKRISLIEGDILNIKDLENNLFDYDIVIHLAAQIDVKESIKNPDFTIKQNVEGTINVLNICDKNKIPNFITASSAAVYGHSSQLPLTEKSPTNPISPYGQSKLIMEQNLKKFSQSHDLNSIVLRFFNVYGPNQTDAYAGVITKFLSSIFKNEALTIFGDGSATRDFIYLDDVLNSIDCAISNIDSKKGDVYNIGTGNSISIKQLAKTLMSISNKDLPINYTKFRAGDILHSQTSIELAEKELGFSQKVSLETGLKKLIKYLS